MEWPCPIETKFVLGQLDVSSVLRKQSFQHLFIPHEIKNNSVFVFVLEKKEGSVMWYCEIVHCTITHSKCRDFVICQFGLSANSSAYFFFVYTPILFEVCLLNKKKKFFVFWNCEHKNCSQKSFHLAKSVSFNS